MSAARARPLVVAADDEPDALRLVELCLTRSGFDVVSAHDGALALELIHHEHPSACVLDVMMPVLGGLDVVRLMRQDPVTRSIPVVLLTAAARIEDEMSGREAGADAYLTKPFRREELVARVQELIDRTQG